MTENTQPEAQPEIIAELQQHTLLLKSINGKIGFFVFILVVYIFISILSLFIR